MVEDRYAVTSVNSLFRAIGLLTVLQDAKGCSASAVIPHSVPGDYAHAGNLRSLEKTTSSRPLDSDCVDPMDTPSAPILCDSIEQVEHKTRSNHVHTNAYVRYSEMSDLCRVFGLPKKKLKKETERKKNKMTTTTKESQAQYSSLLLHLLFHCRLINGANPNCLTVRVSRYQGMLKR